MSSASSVSWSSCLLAVLLVVTAILQPGACQSDNFQCPDELPGFFPHDISCDKYWRCQNSVATLMTCGNGLAFDDTDLNYERENCDYLHNVDCGERTELEPAITAPHCPRLHGIFADDNNCSTFWSCWAGEARRYECPPGLAYDRSKRVCVWSDQVSECTAEELAGGFQCPAEETSVGTYTLYAHPDDCRLYYVCMNRSPREYGCPIGTVFKIGDAEGRGQCSSPEDVPGCDKYYGDLDMATLKKLSGGRLIGGSVAASSDNNEAAAFRSAKQPSLAASAAKQKLSTAATGNTVLNRRNF